ncbi:MAG: type 1 glutamine amidotransferase family protein [Candidatus Dormibacteria bacterium]
MNTTAGAAGMPRALCIMGSGETTPTMVAVHADLLSRLGPRPVPAVLLDTPFGFQENAADISDRTVTYFRDRVGYPVSVASFRNREQATALEYETMLARVAEARYVFAGPGSPSYALRQWLGTAVPDLLAAKLRDGGGVTFASAAAVGLGVCSLPVYEVYKVGEEPHWLEGLDLLSVIGLRAAVVPHYNNAEGGTHDTRYCYMGERRLRILEDLLPEGVDILGVDEHTAAIFDIDARTVSIRGRGGLTWRRMGASQRFESGITMPISELAAGVVSSGSAPATPPGAPGIVDGDALPTAGASPFLEEVSRQSDAADAALTSRDVDGAVGAVLAIDSQIHDWAADTLDSDEQDRARETLRRYVVRLGDLARNGAADPRDLIGPLVDGILELRVQMRGAGEYALADRLRDALVEAGVEVHDTPAGSTWDLAAASSE